MKEVAIYQVECDSMWYDVTYEYYERHDGMNKRMLYATQHPKPTRRALLPKLYTQANNSASQGEVVMVPQALWHDIRSLQEGTKADWSSQNAWSDWDQSVIDRCVELSLSKSATPPKVEDPMLVEAVRIARLPAERGQSSPLINAIRYYRNTTGSLLIDAKEEIERALATPPKVAPASERSTDGKLPTLNDPSVLMTDEHIINVLWAHRHEGNIAGARALLLEYIALATPSEAPKVGGEDADLIEAAELLQAHAYDREQANCRGEGFDESQKRMLLLVQRLRARATLAPSPSSETTEDRADAGREALRKMIAWHDKRDRGPLPAGSLLAYGPDLEEARRIVGGLS